MAPNFLLLRLFSSIPPHNSHDSTSSKQHELKSSQRSTSPRTPTNSSLAEHKLAQEDAERNEAGEPEEAGEYLKSDEGDWVADLGCDDAARGRVREHEVD